MNSLFIATIALGLITSYTDIKEGKIRNFHLILYGVAFVLLAGDSPFITQNIQNLLLYWAIIAILGFAVWKAKVWSAADSKLFTAYAMSIPVIIQTQNSYQTAFDLAVNTVLPAMLFILGTKLIAKERIFKIPKKQTILSSAVFAAFSYLALTWIFIFIPVSLQNLSLFCALIIIFIVIKYTWKKYGYTVLAPIAVLRFIFDSSLYTLVFWAMFLVSMAIMIFLCIIEPAKNKKQTTPFAPYLFFGAIVTIGIHTNILAFIFMAIAKLCINTAHTDCISMIGQRFI